MHSLKTITNTVYIVFIWRIPCIRPIFCLIFFFFLLSFPVRIFVECFQWKSDVWFRWYTMADRIIFWMKMHAKRYSRSMFNFQCSMYRGLSPVCSPSANYCIIQWQHFHSYRHSVISNGNKCNECRIPNVKAIYPVYFKLEILVAFDFAVFRNFQLTLFHHLTDVFIHKWHRTLCYAWWLYQKGN